MKKNTVVLKVPSLKFYPKFINELGEILEKEINIKMIH
jgi:hypothetical protein